MSCSVSFLDGPNAGRSHTFYDRDEPPRLITANVPAGHDRYGNEIQKVVTYVREPSPYPDGPEWVYLTQTESNVEP